MYNAHRGMGPGPQHGSSRLAELLDQVRNEYDAAAGRSNDHEHQVHTQLQEMDLVRTKIFQLEQAHTAMKAKYEDEIARLHRELEQRGGPPQGGQAQAPPPAIGHGPANLFQGIMAGSAAQGGPGLPPQQQQQQQQQQQEQAQSGIPGQMHAPPAPSSFNPQGPPQHPFQYGQPQPPPATGMNGYAQQQQPPQQTASPGPGRSGVQVHPGPPATPHQRQPTTYPSSPYAARPTPPPNGQLHHPHSMGITQYSDQDIDRIGNCLSEYEIDKLPQHYKKSGSDWHAVFNPQVIRRLDVDLVHTLDHGSVVCCVRFSGDGRYVATGCNRSAQIFDVETGQQVCKLQDGSVSGEGDLYIRSVCFSPDGRYLATGAEDKIIRVWDIAQQVIRHQFSGHEQDIYSLDFAADGRHIASGSGDRSIRLWDIQEGQCILSMTIEDGVTTVAISPDNRLVAAGSLDKSVRIWDIKSGHLMERTEGEIGHNDSVYSVAFSPDGRHLVSGSLDKTIKMWELEPRSRGDRLNPPPRPGKCVKTFEGHKDFVLSVALTPDGNWVVSGSKDRGVQFWDPLTGQAHLMLQGHKNSVISVAPSPRPGLFATGSGDQKARIWRYDPFRG